MSPFRRLHVWAKAHELTLRVHRALPGSDHPQAAVGAQLRRAIAAIPATIAAGAGLGSQARLARALEVAIAASHAGLYQLLLARDLGLLAPSDYAMLEARTREVQAKLVLLRRRVRQRIAGNAKRGGRAASPPPATESQAAVRR